VLQSSVYVNRMPSSCGARYDLLHEDVDVPAEEEPVLMATIFLKEDSDIVVVIDEEVLDVGPVMRVSELVIRVEPHKVLRAQPDRVACP